MKIVDLIDKLQIAENTFGPDTEVLLYPPFSDPDEDPYDIDDMMFREYTDEDRGKEWAKGSTAAAFVLLYPYG